MRERTFCSLVLFSVLPLAACSRAFERSTPSILPIGPGPQITLSANGTVSAPPVVAAYERAVTVAWKVDSGQVYVASSVDGGTTFAKPRLQASETDTPTLAARAAVKTPGSGEGALRGVDLEQAATALGVPSGARTNIGAAVQEDKTLTVVWGDRDQESYVIKLGRVIPQHGYHAVTAHVLDRSAARVFEPAVAAIAGGVVAAWARTGDTPLIVVERVGLETLCFDPSNAGAAHGVAGRQQ
jgi:hypothetical protein